VQLENAGFKIMDCLCWAYAESMPRPLNIDREFDREAGFEIHHDPDEAYEPQTEDGKTWKGWANLLKVAWEPIIMAQKPLEGRYIDNVLKWHVGGLNIDACRIPYASQKDKKSVGSFAGFAGEDHGDDRYFSANAGKKKQANTHPDGRWPANLVYLDPLFVGYDRIFMVPKPKKKDKGKTNTHLTVKPVKLMERLVTLVTPKPSVVKSDVVVLDPFMGCYDDKTEVLTRSGWKLFSRLSGDEEYITRNLAGIIEYQKAIQVLQYPYSGKMIKIRSRSTDLLVTPNHQMLVVTHADFCGGRPATLMRADEMKMDVYRIPCGGTYRYETDFLSAEMMYLIGLYVSEGYFDARDNIVICQNRGLKWDEMWSQLGPLKPSVRDSRRFAIRLPTEMSRYIRDNCGTGKYNKYLSERILSNSNLSMLFSAMMLGDGHTALSGQKVYYTTSNCLAGNFQELCVKLGLNSTLIRRPGRHSMIDGRKINGAAEMFEVCVRRSKHQKVVTNRHLSETNYDGQVYCVTVPNHVLLVRRNGRVSWCGNSGTTGIAVKNLGRKFVGFEINKEYYDIAANRLSSKARVRDLFAI
jgi:DNA modification methylase